MLSLAWNGCFISKQSQFRIDLQKNKIKVPEINLRLQYNKKAKKYLSENKFLHRYFMEGFFFFKNEDMVLEILIILYLMTIQVTNLFSTDH